MRYRANSYLELGRLKYRLAFANIKAHSEGKMTNTMDELYGDYSKDIIPDSWTLRKWEM